MFLQLSGAVAESTWLFSGLNYISINSYLQLFFETATVYLTFFGPNYLRHSRKYHLGPKVPGVIAACECGHSPAPGVQNPPATQARRGRTMRVQPR